MWVFAMMLLATPWMVTAQGILAPGEKNHIEDVSSTIVSTAPVLFDGEALFQVRGISALPAEVRARKISERMESFAADLSRSTQSLRLVEEKRVLKFLPTTRN